jgi:hypothetical protein
MTAVVFRFSVLLYVITGRIMNIVKRQYSLGLFICYIMFLWPSLVNANTYMVTNLNDSGPGSLRQAISDATGNPGSDVVNFSVSGTIVLSSPLSLTDSNLITIDGSGQKIAISGNNLHQIFDAAGPKELKKLTLKNATAAFGSVIQYSTGGSLTMSDCILENNQDVAILGRGPSGPFSIFNTTFNNNKTVMDYRGLPPATLTNCTFASNQFALATASNNVYVRNSIFYNTKCGSNVIDI